LKVTGALMSAALISSRVYPAGCAVAELWLVVVLEAVGLAGFDFEWLAQPAEAPISTAVAVSPTIAIKEVLIAGLSCSAGSPRPATPSNYNRIAWPQPAPVPACR
jgi:hypothetical protein